MKHSASELFELVHQFYPRGVWPDGASYESTVERGRQVEAVRGARADYARWRAMLGRIRARFAALALRDRGLPLLAGSFVAAYSGALVLPPPEAAKVGRREDMLGFEVSILAPYYVVYRSRIFFLEGDPSGDKATLPEVRLDLAGDEQAYAREVGREIEATYGYEVMPPEAGRLLVPEVATCFRGMGEATIYDCLLSDEWLTEDMRRGG